MWTSSLITSVQALKELKCKLEVIEITGKIYKGGEKNVFNVLRNSQINFINK